MDGIAKVAVCPGTVGSKLSLLSLAVRLAPPARMAVLRSRVTVAACVAGERNNTAQTAATPAQRLESIRDSLTDNGNSGCNTHATDVVPLFPNNSEVLWG